MGIQHVIPTRHPDENRGGIYNGLKTLDSPVSSTGQAQVKHGMTARQFNHKFKGLDKKHPDTESLKDVSCLTVYTQHNELSRLKI